MIHLGSDRTENFCFTRTEPNLDFLFAEPNRTEPNRTRAIYEDLGRIIWSFTTGAQDMSVSVVKVNFILNFDIEKVLYSMKITIFLSMVRSWLPKERNFANISPI